MLMVHSAALGLATLQDDFDPLPKVVLEYVDITPMLNLPDVGLQWIPFPGAPPAAEDDGPLAAGAAPAVPGPAAEAEAAPVVAQPAGTANGAPAVELSLGAPADAQATDLPPPASLAAAPAQQRCDAAGPSAPSRQESALQPQCAVAMGAALDQEVSTAQLAPLPPREPSQQYNAVAAGLRAAIVPPEDTGVNWDHFPNFLGDGTRARLLALATLHLSSEATPASVAAHAAYPTFAIKALPANSNKILLGAANNCELYQERVVRWARAQARAAGLNWLVGCNSRSGLVGSSGFLVQVCVHVAAVPLLAPCPVSPADTVPKLCIAVACPAQSLAAPRCLRVQGPGTEGGRAPAAG